jgi:hypothetical protein
MSRARIRRHLVALAAMACLLFTHLAVAAYACGGEADRASPALCQAHCEQASCSLDRPNVPPVGPLAANGLDAPAFVPPLASLHTRPQDDLLVRATSPPLAIRHCRFRI